MWEIAGLMGHTSTRMVERIYAKHHPDFMKRATDALDTAFGIEVFRANFVPVPEIQEDEETPEKENPQVFQGVFMVGAAGIEPATPTMSKQRKLPDLLDLRGFLGTRKDWK